MAEHTCETVRVQSDNPEHAGFIEINKSDFDRKTMKLYDGPDPATVGNAQPGTTEAAIAAPAAVTLPGAAAPQSQGAATAPAGAAAFAPTPGTAAGAAAADPAPLGTVAATDATDAAKGG